MDHHTISSRTHHLSTGERSEMSLLTSCCYKVHDMSEADANPIQEIFSWTRTFTRLPSHATSREGQIVAWLPFANVFVIAYVLRANLLAILSGHLHSQKKIKIKKIMHGTYQRLRSPTKSHNGDVACCNRSSCTKHEVLVPLELKIHHLFLFPA